MFILWERPFGRRAVLPSLRPARTGAPRAVAAVRGKGIVHATTAVCAGTEAMARGVLVAITPWAPCNPLTRRECDIKSK